MRQAQSSGRRAAEQERPQTGARHHAPDGHYTLEVGNLLELGRFPKCRQFNTWSQPPVLQELRSSAFAADFFLAPRSGDT